MRALKVILLLVLFSGEIMNGEPLVLRGDPYNLQQVGSLPPLPTDIADAKKVFVRNGTNDPEVYSRFVTDLAAWGKYAQVGSPADADVIFEFHDKPLAVVITDPSTGFVLATVTVSYVPPSRDKDKEDSVAAQNLVAAVKQFVGAPLTSREVMAMTPPSARGKHQALMVGAFVAGSLVIAVVVVLVLHGRGH